MNLIRRAIAAHKDSRLLSGAIRHIQAATIDTEPIQCFRLALPRVSGCDFPTIVTSGDFSNSEGRALKASLKAAIDGRSKLPPQRRLIPPLPACLTRNRQISNWNSCRHNTTSLQLHLPNRPGGGPGLDAPGSTSARSGPMCKGAPFAGSTLDRCRGGAAPMWASR
jgi:hypothetical protein